MSILLELQQQQAQGDYGHGARQRWVEGGYHPPPTDVLFVE